jgi:hypothetical protein
MKNGIFWDVRPSGSCNNRRFGGTYHFLHQSDKNRLLVAVSVIPSSQILVTLMKGALTTSKSLFLQEPYGITSQKTPFFIVIAVKTSNLTR